MHICHINLAKEFRGGERQTFLLMKGLSDNGISQTLICRKHSPLEKKAKHIDGLQVIGINKPFLFHLNKTSHCDLLHVHEGRSTHSAFYNNLLRKIPYIITRRIPNTPGSSFLTKQAYHTATHIVGLSNAIKQQLQNYDHNFKISIIPSMRSDFSYDPQTVEKLKRQYKDKIVVGHIGALVDQHKGQLTLIEAAKTLAVTHPNIHFLLLGNGKDEAWLKKEAGNLKNLTFEGFVENVGDYLKLFDIFIFPSREEGLGSILLDVMQFEIPIIASDVDGIPDIISDHKNGLLIQPGNAEQLCEKILQVINDPLLSRRLTENALEKVADYSMEKITKEYLALYQNLLQATSANKSK